MKNYVDSVGAEAGFLGSLERTVLFVGRRSKRRNRGRLLSGAAAEQHVFKGRAVAVAMLTIPMMLTPVALAYIWKYMFDPQLGVRLMQS